jgi:hypothetical protein
MQSFKKFIAVLALLAVMAGTAFGAPVCDQSTGKCANVPADGSLQTTGAAAMDKGGYRSFVVENDAGVMTGSKHMASPYVSEQRRLAVGLDTVIFTDTFNATTQNTGIWKSAANVLTFSFSGGYVNFNSALNTAAGSQIYQSYEYFPLYGNSVLLVDITGALTAVPPANFQMEAGLFRADATAQPYTPTDGVYFRVTSAGLIGVVNYAGSETTTGVLMSTGAIGINVNGNYRIILSEDNVEFWGNGYYLGALPTPAGYGQPMSAASNPISIRQYQPGVAGAAISIKISDITVTLGDIQTAKPWAEQMGHQGMAAYQGQNGMTMGTTALYANSAAPTAAVPTNTTAALGAGLGGHFYHTNTLAINTDGIISSYQVPAGTTAITPRQLCVTGVAISTGVNVTLANAAGAMYNWSLAYGHTTVTLATTETVITKAPRRIALGVQGAVGALVQGTVLPEINRRFNTPICVNPGEFLQTVVKNTGTVGTAGQLDHHITFDGYWQ